MSGVSRLERAEPTPQLLLGFPESIVAAFGGFTVIFGGFEPMFYRGFAVFLLWSGLCGISR